MNKTPIYSVAIMLIALSLGCCSKKSISRRYYTINISNRLDSVVRPSNYLINARCDVARVDIEEAYSSHKIANRTQSNEITYYVYNEWAHEPSEVISRILKQFVECQGIFNQVSSRFTTQQPDYRIETNIEHLEAIESKDQLEAYLEIEFRLINLADGNILVIHRAVEKKPLIDKDLNLYAAAISDILYEEIQNFSMKIKEAYRNNSSIFH